MAGMADRYLVDTSAWARMHLPPVGDTVSELIQLGAVATCSMVDLEILYSARNAHELRATRVDRELGLINLPMSQSDFDRAKDIMEALASTGRHRAARLPDLLIAAVAERTGLTVLHYDEDFDQIASVTGQPVQWVAPRGSL